MERLVKTDLYIYNSNKLFNFIDLFAIGPSAYVDFFEFYWQQIHRIQIDFQRVAFAEIKKGKMAGLLAKLIQKLGKQKGYVCGSYL